MMSARPAAARAVAAAVLLVAPGALAAQPITPVVTVRVRGEAMNWFGDAPGGAYSFLGAIVRLGLEQQGRRFGWHLEFAAPILLGLPADAIDPAPRGLLGLGANYYKANDNSTSAASLFLKEGYLRARTPDRHWQGRLGRFEFTEGAEVMPANPALAAVKRSRIAQRLIGPFGFSHVGRSFDGLDLEFNQGKTNLRLVAGFPTTGVFRTNGWGHLSGVVVGYGALTAPGPFGAEWGEFRLFGMYYRDGRKLLKTDNRPLADRQTDQDPIAVGTFGAHYLQSVSTRAGPVDLLAWSALQFGEWGRLDHRALAGTVEFGWQPDLAPGVRPWVRVGYFRSSGDRNPEDGTHQTFFQILPTPRVYARFPFFNLMNLEDLSASLTLRPGTRTTFRADVRKLRLSNRADGWYVGGGAFAKDDFGYAMRPSNQLQNLATLLDLSLDVRVAPRWTVAGYGAHAKAGPVIETIYPAQPGGWYGYLEVEYRR